jgi:hypothetical protein
VKVVPPADLKIVNVALGHKLSDASGRTTLTMTYYQPHTEDDDEEDEDEAAVVESTAVLCSLTPGKVRLSCTFSIISTLYFLRLNKLRLTLSLEETRLSNSKRWARSEIASLPVFGILDAFSVPYT